MLQERAATWPKQWMAEGFEKGRKKGQKEGQKEGRKSGLLEGRRIGSLGAHHKKLIAEASKDQLRKWSKRVLTAGSTDDLFRS